MLFFSKNNFDESFIANETEDSTSENAQITQSIPSLDQLKKMNINQLKAIASQIGINVDVSKMKKPDLISLIRENRE